MKKYILKYWILISVLAVVVVTEATLRLALGQGLPVLIGVLLMFYTFRND